MHLSRDGGREGRCSGKVSCTTACAATCEQAMCQGEASTEAASHAAARIAACARGSGGREGVAGWRRRNWLFYICVPAHAFMCVSGMNGQRRMYDWRRSYPLTVAAPRYTRSAPRAIHFVRPLDIFEVCQAGNEDSDPCDFAALMKPRPQCIAVRLTGSRKKCTRLVFCRPLLTCC